jgi:hypothetical protein
LSDAQGIEQLREHTKALEVARQAYTLDHVHAFTSIMDARSRARLTRRKTAPVERINLRVTQIMNACKNIDVCLERMTQQMRKLQPYTTGSIRLSLDIWKLERLHDDMLEQVNFMLPYLS